MRGELVKVALSKTDVVSKHSSSEILVQEYVKCLSLELLDDEYINAAKLMATVYTAIAAFENTVRQFVVKVLLEHKGENWWEDCVSEKIRKTADSRKKEEEKIRWHTVNPLCSPPFRSGIERGLSLSPLLRRGYMFLPKAERDF